MSDHSQDIKDIANAIGVLFSIPTRPSASQTALEDMVKAGASKELILAIAHFVDAAIEERFQWEAARQAAIVRNASRCC